MKTVLITGASGGIGRALAKSFCDKQHILILQYRREDSSFFEFTQSITADCAQVHCIQADFSNAEQVETFLDQVLQLRKTIDVFIHNAGIGHVGLLQDTTQEQWHELMQVHVHSLFSMTKRILPSMIQQKQGCIIPISSIWGISGASCEVAYSTAKAAVIGFTKALAAEVGPSGIRVNCVAPGIVQTPMNANYSTEELQDFVQEIPLQRIGQPAEIASTVRFLASDEATYITGQVISPNGGLIRGT